MSVPAGSVASGLIASVVAWSVVALRSSLPVAQVSPAVVDHSGGSVIGDEVDNTIACWKLR